MALLFLALALLLQTPAAPPRDGQVRPDQVVGKGVLRGRVLDAQSGQPLKNATVTVFSPRFGQEPPSTTTDGEGRWEISGLPSGEYHVSASKGGFSEVRADVPRSIGLTDSRPDRSVDVRLVRGAVLSGRITDGDGEPVVGAQVMTLREILDSARQAMGRCRRGAQYRRSRRVQNLGPRGWRVPAGGSAGRLPRAASSWQANCRPSRTFRGRRCSPRLRDSRWTPAPSTRLSLSPCRRCRRSRSAGGSRTSGERFTNGFGMMFPADEIRGRSSEWHARLR